MVKGPKRVVVVEDDEGLRHAIQRVLRAAGFAVTGHPNAQSALQDPGLGDSFCLVLDIHLPDVSGFDLYEQLGASGSTPRVIFITARDEARNRERATALGALDYMVKPFSGRALAAVVAGMQP
jgi:DNA-binding response OmpR family regulator